MEWKQAAASVPGPLFIIRNSLLNLHCHISMHPQVAAGIPVPREVHAAHQHNLHTRLLWEQSVFAWDSYDNTDSQGCCAGSTSCSCLTHFNTSTQLEASGSTVTLRCEGALQPSQCVVQMQTRRTIPTAVHSQQLKLKHN